jgi:hypothetical protein
MSTRFAWVLNLDAELELLRGRPGYVPQRKLVAQLAQHGAAARALLGPDDVLLEETSSLPAAAASDFRGRAWCPTPRAIERLHRHGVTVEPHPSAEILRRVNHRLFAHELGGGLAEQAYVRTRQELTQHLGNYGRRWLLKRPLTFAGRGQLRVIGPLSEKQWTWVDASLARDGFIVEPLVTPTLEVSLHGFIRRDGRFELGRSCVQLVSERGTYRGVRLSRPGDLEAHEERTLQGSGETVARALVGAGYFGPFGIDAYRYELDGRIGFCALSEVNARYTLAFVTGFPRPPHELEL